MRQLFSEVEWTELDQIWRGHRTIVGAPKIPLHFRYFAAIRNKGGWNVTKVENWGQFRTFWPLQKPAEGWTAAKHRNQVFKISNLRYTFGGNRCAGWKRRANEVNIEIWGLNKTILRGKYTLPNFGRTYYYHHRRSEFVLHFRCNAPFRNQSDSKTTAVDNREQMSDFLTPV